LTLSNRVSEAWRTQSEKGEEGEVPRGFSEGKRTRNMRSTGGAGMGEVKTKEEND
jgi:hypothetical protein